MIRARIVPIFIGILAGLAAWTLYDAVQNEKEAFNALSAEDQATLAKFRKDVSELQMNDVVVMDDGTWIVVKQIAGDVQLEGPGPKSNPNIGLRSYMSIGIGVATDLKVMRKFRRIVKYGDPDYKRLMSDFLFD